MQISIEQAREMALAMEREEKHLKRCADRLNLPEDASEADILRAILDVQRWTMEWNLAAVQSRLEYLRPLLSDIIIAMPSPGRQS